MNRTNAALVAGGSLAIALLLTGCAPGAQPTPSASGTHTSMSTPTSAPSSSDGPSTASPPPTVAPTSTPTSSALDPQRAWDTCASALKSQYGISPLSGYSASDVIADGSGFDVAIGFDPSTGQGRQSPFVCTINGTAAAPIIQQTHFGK